MIFIAGTSFQYKGQSSPERRPLQPGSIQEQLLVKKYQPVQNTVKEDDGFIIGNVYKISRIRKIIVENLQKIEYLFTNTTNNTIPDISMTFISTSVADDYIAGISGNTQKLQEERAAILSANSRDF